MSCFESGELTSARAIEAEQGMKMIYSTAEKHHWSLMASDGDMMAFLHLVSDRLVCSYPLPSCLGVSLTEALSQLTLEIDAASSENLRPLDDYETRKAGKFLIFVLRCSGYCLLTRRNRNIVDEHIELNVEIAPKNLKSIPAMKPIRDLSNIIVFSDDVDELESTHASLVEKLGAARGKISKTIVKRLLKAGVEGVRLSDLIVRVTPLSSHILLLMICETTARRIFSSPIRRYYWRINFDLASSRVLGWSLVPCSRLGR